MNMTLERAIEILDPEHREHYDSIEPVITACRMGMDALKKQVQMEPDEENSEMDGWAVCPSCGEYITHPDGHEVTYCRYCGQAIKWEDEEDDE